MYCCCTRKEKFPNGRHLFPMLAICRMPGFTTGMLPSTPAAWDEEALRFRDLGVRKGYVMNSSFNIKNLTDVEWKEVPSGLVKKQVW